MIRQSCKLRLAGRRPRETDRSALRGLTRNDSGQSLVIVVIAMVLIVAMAAFSIDVAQWDVSRHQAQVVADSAALAAANCLASTTCTSTTAGGDAATMAGNYASNNVHVTGVSFSNSNVTVTTQKTASSGFAGLFGINSLTTTASATANFNTLTGYSDSCSVTGASSCYSLFAGNPNCDTSVSIPSNYVGLDLVTNDSGGGSSNMTNVFTNGYYWNGASSGASSFGVTTVGTSSPPCTEYLAKSTTTYKYTPNILPYPEPWPQPKCGFTAASWTPAQIASSGPGIYCVNATPTASCTNYASGTGDIDVNLNQSGMPSGGYEFVGPCVTIAGQSNSVTSIKNQPLVYGTSNIATSGSKLAIGTNKALPTCIVNNGTNGTSTWLDGNPTQGPTIYDQCGTAEITGNGGYVGFIEAWNISLDKNNAMTGNGPTSVLGGGITPLPGGDSLTG